MKMSWLLRWLGPVLMLTLAVSCGHDDDDDSAGGDDDSGDDDTGDDDTGDDDAGDDDDDTAATDWALMLDGTTAYGRTLGLLAPQMVDALTVEGWLYLSNATPIEPQYVFETSGSNSGTWMYYDSYDHALKFAYVDTPTRGSGGLVSSTGPVTVGQWFHFAATYTDDGTDTTICLYIDGDLDACELWTNSVIILPQGQFVLGRYDDGPMLYLEGGVNELRVSNVVRYTSSFTVPTEPLVSDADTVALYHFDEGGGGSGVDASPNGNDLILTGGVSWTEFEP